MPYKENIISQEMFWVMVDNNIPYEGFVVGLGYVSPEVVVVEASQNKYYKIISTHDNLSYNLITFPNDGLSQSSFENYSIETPDEFYANFSIGENLDNIGYFGGNIAKGFDFGFKQRFQLEPARGDALTGIRDTHAGKIRGGKPVGEWYIRVDKAHKGVNYPHININPRLTGIPDPHIAINPNTLKALENTGKTLNVIGKVAKPVAIVTDGVRIGNAYREDGNTIGKNTAVVSAEVAGGWAGAWAGAKLGAAGGAAIGSLFPGAGTAIGGFVGAIGGAIGGAFGGSWLAKEGTTAIIEANED